MISELPYFNKLMLFVVMIAVCCPFAAYCQIVTTYAGSDAVVLGDGGPATNACIKSPTGVAFDPAGNLLIAEQAGYRVRRVNTAGIISTVAGNGVYVLGGSGDGGPATDASVYTSDIACDGAGNIYILDGTACRIRKVNMAGIITTVAGTGSTIESGDGGPATAAGTPAQGIEIDEANNIYIAYGGNVRKIDAVTGIIKTIAGTSTVGFSGDGGPATAAQFNIVGDVAVRNGNIYILDRLNYRVRKVNTAGIVTTVAGNGSMGFSGDGGSATEASFNANQESLFVDEAECIYIADRLNYRVRKVNALGIVTTIAGNGSPWFAGDGGPATAAAFGYLRSVAKKSGGGNIFVADRGCNRARMITDQNHPAHFTGGHALPLVICVPDLSDTPPAIYIGSLLTAVDADTAQPIKWELVHGPANGIVNTPYSSFTTGSIMIPSGLTYTPYAGYTGYDTFRIRVTDAYSADTATVYVRVDGPANAGILSGPDSVCKGSNMSLTTSVTGGVFSVRTGAVSVTGGMVTGITAGRDTVVYILTNSCGKDTTMHVVQVTECVTGISTPSASVAGTEELRIWPNPCNAMISLHLSAYSDEPVNVTITNAIGQVIQEFTAVTNQQKDITLHTAPGIYLVTTSTAHGLWRQKIVVE